MSAPDIDALRAIVNARRVAWNAAHACDRDLSAAVATEPAPKDQPARPLQTARYLDGVHGTPEEAADAVVDAWSPA